MLEASNCFEFRTAITLNFRIVMLPSGCACKVNLFQARGAGTIISIAYSWLKPANAGHAVFAVLRGVKGEKKSGERSRQKAGEEREWDYRARNGSV